MGNIIKKLNVKKLAIIVGLVLAAVISVWPLANHYSDPTAYTSTIETLDEKRNNVLLMTGSAVAASTAMTMLPGDLASPVANELADLSSTLALVLGAIFLEKYMLTLSGALAFRFIIPIACLLFITYFIIDKKNVRDMGIKLLLFALCIWLVVPLSTKVTNFIEETNSINIQETVENIDESVEDIEKQNQDKNFFEEAWDKISSGVTGVIDNVKDSVGNFVEATAILIITSCVIPIMTFMAMIWGVKLIFGFSTNISSEQLHQAMHSGSRLRNKALETKNKIENH